MNTSILKLTTLFLVLVFAVTACVNQTPMLDQHFGEAVNAAKLQQMINSEALQKATPETLMDGQAAKSAIEQYQKSFSHPPVTPNVFNIGVGTSSSGGSSQ